MGKKVYEAKTSEFRGGGRIKRWWGDEVKYEYKRVRR